MRLLRGFLTAAQERACAVDKALLWAAMQAVGRRMRRRIIGFLFPLYRAFGGFRVIGSSEVSSSGSDCEVTHLEGEEEICIPEPTSVQRELAIAMYGRMVGRWSIQNPYVLVARNARLLGPAATALTRSGGILSDTIASENYLSSRAPASLSSLLMALLPPSSLQHLPGYWCSLVSLWSGSYFHWLVETLPRLCFVETWREASGVLVKFIVDARPTKWQLASLRLLGVSDETILVWNGRGALVECLVVPSFPRRLCLPGRRFSVVSPASLRWVRERVLFGLGSSGLRRKEWPRRIVISRRMASGRRIANEEEMLGFLERLGFQAFCLEEMSFDEQADLFSAAEVVIGPHGAGLANMIFASHLKVVELFGSYTNPSFFTLASVLGFRYAFLKCEAIKTLHPHRHDLRVDLGALQELLRHMDIS